MDIEISVRFHIRIYNDEAYVFDVYNSDYSLDSNAGSNPDTQNLPSIAPDV